jgi:hypothetical protein
VLGRRNDDGESKRAREDKRTNTKLLVQCLDDESNIGTGGKRNGKGKKPNLIRVYLVQGYILRLVQREREREPKTYAQIRKGLVTS